MAVGMSAAQALTLQRDRLMKDFDRLGREGIKVNNSAGDSKSLGSILGSDRSPSSDNAPKPS